ncbi:MAG: hypothetical protein HKO59_13990, partial [Phycisphaerales bacterium]|nr:hypothetical protein [Phycisphaerae bacterium]NNM27072.1 hypothetical protein [Phycisphaerales bacterium]
ARLFALFFDAAARQVDRRHVATLRDGTVSFTFRPTPEASHLALAAHLGDQSPERRLRLTALTLDAVPTSPAYGRLPVAEVARKR